MADAMTVGQLIAKLSEVPQGWTAWGTRKGSIHVEQPGTGPGRKYGYVFTDDRPTLLFHTTR